MIFYIGKKSYNDDEGNPGQDDTFEVYSFNIVQDPNDFCQIYEKLACY